MGATVAIIEKLRDGQGLSTAELDLADFILRHADEVVHMGMREVAAASLKSNSTIMHLCRKMGSSGWRAFRVDLAADVERLRSRNVLIDPNEPFRGRVSTQAAMHSIAALKREAVEDCYAFVSPDQVDALTEAMLRARRVIVYARGDSYQTGLVFGGLMSKIGVTCIPFDLYRFKNATAYHATPDDLALVISYSGDLVGDLGLQLGTLAARGCQVAVVTANEAAARQVGVRALLLGVPWRENKYGKVATFYSQACLRYALDCVYSVAFSRNYQGNLHDKNQIEMLEPVV